MLGHNDAGLTAQYVDALYFSVTTMCTIGYGDIKPANNTEYIVVIFLELVAGIILSYIIGKIGTLFGRYNLAAVNYK